MKFDYEAPNLDVIEVAVEEGFATSGQVSEYPGYGDETELN